MKLSHIPRHSVLRKASICSCPTPLAPFWPNRRWERSRCKTSMAMSWKPPSWLPPRSASTYDRRRSGSFCLMNCAAEKSKNKTIHKNQMKNTHAPFLHVLCTVEQISKTLFCLAAAASLQIVKWSPVKQFRPFRHRYPLCMLLKAHGLREEASI